ncbi:MAG: hypothetical protein R3280_13380 [Marinobacter sp.]|uniref:hypothetical protein n=1 Tax=Marinobacter sp. TaxID=50741 RepID=UPI00299E390C|nr:hypothetical protein [Marinobacter sp.]MDX1635627.1 hypothetical protein [Marinobacter sp.]
MAKTLCQLALDRVIAYVRGYGMEPTPAVCRQALRLVDAAMDEGSEDLMARVIDRVPDFFELPELQLPRQRPPMKRGSIGYYRHG